MPRFTEIISKHKNFYCVLVSLYLGAFSMGLAMGWPNPTFKHLYSNIIHMNQISNTIYIDTEWIESTLNLGASLGSLFSIFVSEFYGRRTSFGLSASIIVGFWIFLVSAGVDKILIISAAGVAGFGVGIFSATAALYVAEISSIENWGSVGTTILLFGYLGVFGMNLFAYALQDFVIARLLNVMVVMPILFLGTVYFWIIESPFYLFQKGTILQAKICLMNLRDRKNILEIYEEYKSMESFFNSNFFKNPSQLFFEAICPHDLRTATLILMPVLCISQMLGVVALSDYAQQLIESIYPEIGNLVTSLIDVISTILCILAMDALGRKSIMILTITGAGLCCFTLAMYNIASEEQCITKKMIIDHEVLPVLTICLYYAIYGLGLIPVLPIVTGEIFPCRAKTAAVGICSSLLYFVQFCVQRSYETLNKYTSSCLAFVCFTMLGSIGLPFALTAIPETKGKSMVQIQNEMANIIM